MSLNTIATRVGLAPPKPLKRQGLFYLCPYTIVTQFLAPIPVSVMASTGTHRDIQADVIARQRVAIKLNRLLKDQSCCPKSQKLLLCQIQKMHHFD